MIGFCNFLGNNLYSGRTPPVGNGDLVVIWPVLASGTWKWAKMGQKPTKLLFPAGERLTKTNSVPRKLRKTIPDSLTTFFSIKVPLAPGNCVFLFLARAQNSSKCPRPRTGQKPTKSVFPTGGGPTKKKSRSRESCEKPS